MKILSRDVVASPTPSTYYKINYIKIKIKFINNDELNSNNKLKIDYKNY